MVKSMTGYGLSEVENDYYRIRMEVKSVNHRYSNISIRLPHYINHLEEDIKSKIKEKLFRGSIDVYINLEHLKESDVEIKADIGLAKAYKNAFDSINDELELKSNVQLSNILRMQDIIKIERKEINEEELVGPLYDSLNNSLNQVLEMREEEGKNLKLDILKKIESIEKLLEVIEERSPMVVLEYKEKLEEKIGNLLGDNVPIDEDRLTNEIAYFADKSSIDEEIVRLKSHISQMKKTLEEPREIGRKLDFITQELNREINTIGSKSNDSIISTSVVELKSELEKIREQVQNIE